MLKNIANFLKRQNDAGRFQRSYQLAKYIKSFLYFHTWERLRNGTEWLVFHRLVRKDRLVLDEAVLSRVFYVSHNEKDNTVTKIPTGKNQFSDGLIRSLRCTENCSRYCHQISNASRLPHIGKHILTPIHIRKDGGYVSPFVKGISLAEVQRRILMGDHKTLAQGNYATDLDVAIGELMSSLRVFSSMERELTGDWALHNLVFSFQDKCIYNVDLEGFFTYPSGSFENSVKIIINSLGDLEYLTRAATSGSQEDQDRLSVLRKISEVYINDPSEYAGRQFLIGYHSLNLSGRLFRGQRDCQQRLDAVPYNFSGKTVVDLGCNIGGMLHALSPNIAAGIGYDYDQRCIEAANSIAKINITPNLRFAQFDLDQDNLAELKANLETHVPDIIFLLSVCMWIRRWKEIIDLAAARSPRLLFESNGSEAQQSEQLEYLHKRYKRITLVENASHDDPLQPMRRLFLCEDSVMATNALGA